MMSDIQNNWLEGNYLSLSTQKRDGSWVDTPVWFAFDGDKTLYCFSESKAGKVKRIKNFSEVRVCLCTVTGKLTGSWQNASAEILSGEDVATAKEALLKSYGWQMKILNVISTIAGKINKRAFLKISLN